MMVLHSYQTSMTYGEKAAYLAGMIDGEGTITITCHTQHNRKTYQYKPFVYVCNTKEAVMAFMQKEFGGTYRQHENKRKYYRWAVMSLEDIEKILDITLPFLILKREHALILKEYVGVRKKALSLNKNAPYSSIESHCHFRLRNLNRKIKMGVP